MTNVAQDLVGRYSRIIGVRLSMVANSSLQTSGVSRSSADVSTSLDRELLKHLRSLADIAVTDAATAIAESYRPSKLVELEIWTKSGDARGLEDASVGEFRPLRVQQIDDAVVRLQTLRQTHSSILLETGPTVTKLLASAQEIDEASLTVTQAADHDTALASLETFADRIGLDYLKKIETVWLEETLFARLGR
jgi:riboflavin biosynthesis pyrimidine reductase